jgi:dTDP-4-amino-4,6-dideoxygalactose transaminase
MIPFYVPPKLSDQQIEHIQNEIAKVMRTGQITNGKNVRELEERIKSLHDVEHVIACSSATQAMWITLRALNVKGLMIQAFTWKSLSYLLPMYVQYVDVDAETWLMEPSESKYADTIIGTHTFGNTCKVETYRNRPVIYDGAYSLGADLPDIGSATILSLTATKIVPACEGGLILTDNSELAVEAEEIRDKCSRMSELNAIVGLSYLEMLPEILAKKKRIFNYYNSHLPFKSQKASEYGTNYGFYGCLVSNRDEFIERLRGKIDVRIRYEPLQKGFETTDKIASSIVILPCYPDLNPSTVVNEVITIG